MSSTPARRVRKRRPGLLDLPALMLTLLFNILLAYTAWYYWLI